MARMRSFLREVKLPLGAMLLVASLVVMISAIMGIPDTDGNEGTGPLAFLTGFNLFLTLIAAIGAIVGGYVVYRYMYDKRRFEELMGSKSQAIFKRNQIEIERLALRLTNKEEERVLEAMRKYKIK